MTSVNRMMHVQHMKYFYENTLSDYLIECHHLTILDKAIAFDEESWKSILPLDPGKSADIDLLIMPEDAWKAPPNVDNIKSSLTLSYTNQEDDSNGYGREIAFVIDVKMMASLSIESYEVYEITKHPSCCCLCFDVHNHASIDMNFEVFIKETKGNLHFLAFFAVCF